MRAKSFLLLSSATALAVPSAAFACDLEGPGSRFSAFAHMMANHALADVQPDALAPPQRPVSYKDDSRDARSVDTPSSDTVDYNAPASGTSATDTNPSGEAVLR